MFGGILGRIGNTIHNDIVNPISHAFNQSTPHQNFMPAPMQHVNFVQGQDAVPNFGVNQVQSQQGNQARLNAQQQLHFTSAFAQNVANAAPYVGHPFASAALKNQNTAGAQYLGQQRPNQIVLGNNKFGQAPTTVLHEGLHRIYDTNPQVRQQFVSAFNKTNDPGVKSYILGRISGYKGAPSLKLDAGGVPITEQLNIQNLPQNLQNEAHSYASEYYSDLAQIPPDQLAPGVQKTALNSPLARYYSQYFNPRLQSMRKR